MVSCLLVTNNNKPEERKGKVLFLQAVNEVRNEKTISYLDEKHINRIIKAYRDFKVEAGFSEIVENQQIIKDQNARLSVQLFVHSDEQIEEEIDEVISDCEANFFELKQSMSKLLEVFNER